MEKQKEKQKRLYGKEAVEKALSAFIPENINKAIYTIPTAQLFKLW